MESLPRELDLKYHYARCASLNTAKRILQRGRVAVGYPLADGSWSINGEEPLTQGERINLRIQSKNGSKTYAAVTALVLDERSPPDPQGNRAGCFVAVFWI